MVFEGLSFGEKIKKKKMYAAKVSTQKKFDIHLI